MGRDLVKGKTVLQTFLFVIFLFLLPPGEIISQVGLRLPYPPKTVHLIQPESQGLRSLLIDSTLFKAKPPFYKRIVKLDSTGKFISAMESVDQTEFNFPAVVDLDTYIRIRLKYDRKEMWKKSFIQGMEKLEEMEE